MTLKKIFAKLTGTLIATTNKFITLLKIAQYLNLLTQVSVNLM